MVNRDTYDINAPQWWIAGYTDTDGVWGEEIIVQTFALDSFGSPKADRVLIIHDRNQTINEITVFFGSDENGAVWTTFDDLDGEPGGELVFEKTPASRITMGSPAMKLCYIIC